MTNPPSEDPLAGRVLDGRYRVDAPIGQGGMGIVYRGFQPAMDRPVAIKVLRANLGTNPSIVKRFEREARTASRLLHPNIITLYDFGQTSDGLVYIVMELLEGESLRATLDRERRLSPERALDITAQVLDALLAAHTAGIVHRDLKPENVFRRTMGTRGDFVKILDFGIAKFLQPDSPSHVTAAGVVIGTPLYMSPEQVMGDPVDHRTDLYAAGIMLFEMLVGRHPFPAERAMSVLLHHVHKEPPRLEEVAPHLAGSATLQRALDCALAKQPDQRVATASELMEVLARARNELTQTGRAGTVLPPVRAPADLATQNTAVVSSLPPTGFQTRARRRRKWLVALPVAAVLGGAAIAVAAFVGSSDPAPQPPPPASTPSDPPAPAAALPGLSPTAPATVPARPPPPATVTFRVRSRPSGARVLRDGAPAGRTPTTFQVERDADVVLRIEHKGYTAHESTLVASSDQVIDAELARAPRPRRVKVPKKAAAPAASTAPQPPAQPAPPTPPKKRFEAFQL